MEEEKDELLSLAWGIFQNVKQYLALPEKERQREQPVADKLIIPQVKAWLERYERWRHDWTD